MAGIAHVRCIDMGCVFAGCRHPIVTTNTVTCETAMVHHGRQPGRRGMTAVTFGSGNDVVSRFTGRNHIIMTTGANTDDLRVIYCTGCDGRPIRRELLVAGITYIG